MPEWPGLRRNWPGRPASWPLAGRLVSIILVLSLLSSLPFCLAGCGSRKIVGPIDQQASICLLSFERVDAETSGIVYRRIERFDAFVAQAKVPVLLVFYQPLDETNTRVIPAIEQLADDCQGQLAVVWIDATRETGLASDFQVSVTPRFTVLVDAAAKRSLVGFDEAGPDQLRQLVAPYLKK